MSRFNKALRPFPAAPTWRPRPGLIVLGRVPRSAPSLAKSNNKSTLTVKPWLLQVGLQIRIKQLSQRVDENPDSRPRAHSDPAVLSNGETSLQVDVDFLAKEKDAVKWYFRGVPQERFRRHMFVEESHEGRCESILGKQQRPRMKKHPSCIFHKRD